ncbi:MAG: SelL-related redox protein [Verrucomicrobiota bacterium]
MPNWTKATLLLAGIYNLLWGAWVVLLPATAFKWLSVDPPKYLELWQCIGMIVGCYGIAYLIASTNPARYWPITLVGLLGKVAGPIGFIQALSNGVFPLSFGWLIVFNDLIWWIPFVGILWLVWKAYRQEPKTLPDDDRLRLMGQFMTSTGSRFELLDNEPTLLVFLRHSGCTFCREMLADLKIAYPQLQAQGVRVLLVHMSESGDMAQLLDRYGLSDMQHIPDPHCELYRAFGLKKGELTQLFGPQVWSRGWEAGVRQRHGVGWLDGDGFQMPGIFGLIQGKVKTVFIHQHAAERPDYLELSHNLLAQKNQSVKV